MAGQVPGGVGDWISLRKLKLTLQSPFTTILDGWVGVGGRVGGWICLRIKLTSALDLVEVELS